ncbi:MAG: carbonic anhydrase [Chitinophagaceae bacterium]|nr:carbonic anhydrase [Chitinophagaceae bacterium]
MTQIRTVTSALFISTMFVFASCGQNNAVNQKQTAEQADVKPPHITINTPDEALAELKAGNQRFLDGKLINTDYRQEIEESKDGQHPHSIILSCIDSRVPPEIIFDQGIGHIFVARVAGNLIDPNELGSLEFATQVKHSKLIVVLGHSKCGAIEGAVNNVQLGNLTQLLAQIKPAITGDTTNKQLMIEQTTKKNIELTIANILKQSPVISALVKDGNVKIIGAYDDISTGKVTFIP